MEQLLANWLVGAARYAVGSLGLFLFFRVSGAIDFAQAAAFLLGAYGTFAVTRAGADFWVAAFLAVAGSALVGSGVHQLLYRRFQSRTHGSLAVMLASLGLLVVVQNGISLFFGDVSRSFGLANLDVGLGLGNARVTMGQLSLLGCCAGAFVLGDALRKTRWGLVVEAVSSSTPLGQSVGIDTTMVRLQVATAAWGLSAIAGIVTSVNYDVQPGAGMETALRAVLVTLLAGRGGYYRLLLASLALSAVEVLLGTFVSLLWADATSFAVVLVVLHLRRTDGMVAGTGRG